MAALRVLSVWVAKNRSRTTIEQTWSITELDGRIRTGRLRITNHEYATESEILEGLGKLFQIPVDSTDVTPSEAGLPEGSPPPPDQEKD
jgi:hypothetical protein